MPFISVTRLKVRSIFYLPGFLKANNASVKALMSIPGYIDGRELIDKGLVFWTVTAWQAEKAMKEFRNGEAHPLAMQKLPGWCNEAAYVHWVQDTATLPDNQTMYGRLMADGKLTKVRHPSPSQLNKDYPPVKWTKIEQSLKKK